MPTQRWNGRFVWHSESEASHLSSLYRTRPKQTSHLHLSQTTLVSVGRVDRRHMFQSRQRHRLWIMSLLTNHHSRQCQQSEEAITSAKLNQAGRIGSNDSGAENSNLDLHREGEKRQNGRYLGCCDVRVSYKSNVVRMFVFVSL